MTKTNERGDVYQIVTDRVIELLEAGVVPWRKPWTGGGMAIPKNLISKKAYRGMNVWLLMTAGYESPYWMTYNQAAAIGGTVKKGEKGNLVVFWKWLDAEDKQTKEKKRIPMLRYYKVFNFHQCEAVKGGKTKWAKATKFAMVKTETVTKVKAIKAADGIVKGMPNPPKLTHSGEQRAYYSRGEDRVNMPKKATFTHSEEYYSTLFHELTHATGHDSRLGRLQESTSGFGSESYAKEELVAEMGAAFLSGMAGIVNKTIPNSAAYIKSWLGKLKNDNRLVVSAAGAAQKSSDYILGVTFEDKD